MASILTGWWRAAEAAAGLLASPRTDVAAADAAAGRVFGRSLLVRGAAALLDRLERAWQDSTTRLIAHRLSAMVPVSIALRTRFTAVVVIVAGLTVLALQSVKPGPREPLAWFLPAMAIVAAALVAASGALRRSDRQGGR